MTLAELNEKIEISKKDYMTKLHDIISKNKGNKDIKDIIKKNFPNMSNEDIDLAISIKERNEDNFYK